jgi:hypothetical protein
MTTTTKTYQAQLPFRNSRIVTPIPRPRALKPPGVETESKADEALKRVAKSFATLASLAELINHGFWFCADCKRICEREESDHGQPAGCGFCGSPRISYNGPVSQQEAK